MKIVVLMENTTSRENLACEHGLSLYIETEQHRILFDAGQTGAFADHAEKLGVDLSKVDFAVLSHGHYDHGGGLMRFLEINKTAPIYLSPYALEPHYNAAGKYIGLDPALADSGRVILVEDTLELGDGITLEPCRGRRGEFPVDSAGLTMAGGLPEDFRHEQYLLVTESDKRICFSGCSHRGILNIVQWFRPDVLVGGFHFMKMDTTGSDGGKITEAAHTLMTDPTTYYTGHCTGQAQFDLMKPIMGESLRALSTGKTILL